MNSYFISYAIKQEKPEGGFFDSGYGHSTAEAKDDIAIDRVMRGILKTIAEKLNVEEKTIHVIQFNRL